MGSMAEKINLMIDGGARYYKDKVAIADASTMTGSISTTPIAVNRIAEIEAVDGVARASASIYMLLDPEGGMGMGMPQGIVGSDLRNADYEDFKLSLRDGRDLAPSDRSKAVVGCDLAKALDAQVTQPLTKTLEGLKASIDMMAENQAKTNEETLREIVERFSQSITGAAGQEMQEFSKAVQTMSGTLTDQIRAISEQQEAVRKQSQESVEQLASVFQRGAEDLQKRVAASVDEILEGLSTTVKEMSALLDGAAGRVAQQLDRTAAAFGSTVETLTSSVEGIRTILTTANQLMEYVDQLMAATRQALVSAEETGKKLEASARAIDAAAAKSSDSAMATEKSAAALTDAMAAFAASQHRVEQTWGEYQKRFEGLDESLGRAFGEIDSGLQNYARNVRDFTQELDQHTGAITSALTGAVEVLQDAIEDLTDALPQNRAPA